MVITLYFLNLKSRLPECRLDRLGGSFEVCISNVNTGNSNVTFVLQRHVFMFVLIRVSVCLSHVCTSLTFMFSHSFCSRGGWVGFAFLGRHVEFLPALPNPLPPSNVMEFFPECRYAFTMYFVFSPLSIPPNDGWHCDSNSALRKELRCACLIDAVVFQMCMFYLCSLVFVFCDVF